jgi:hypothetical protein
MGFFGPSDVTTASRDRSIDAPETSYVVGLRGSSAEAMDESFQAMDPEVYRSQIFLAAVSVVAGVIGISGIYPQIIDAEWVQGAAGKQKGEAISAPKAPARSNVVNLMDALRKSLESNKPSVQSEKRPVQKPVKKATKPKRKAS